MIELTNKGNGSSILFNVSRIETVFQKSGDTNIYAGGDVPYIVSESYDEVRDILDNYLKTKPLYLPK